MAVRVLTAFLILFLVLGLGACTASLPVFEEQSRDGAPELDAQQIARLAALPDPVPKPEPRSAYGNPVSYEQFGKTYRTLPSASGYDQTGKASWYGSGFHGRRTSSGEPFDMYALTAAHRTLPIPSFVEVTNLDNNRRTLVRVNDRGPFHPERIIDLSFAAAVKLGFHEAGTARVRVRVAAPPPVVALAPEAPVTFHVPQPVYERAETAYAQTDRVAADATAADATAAERATQPSAVQRSAYYLQAGAFAQRQGAERQRALILAALPDAGQITLPIRKRLYRVHLGPYRDATSAGLARQALDQAGFASVVLPPEVVGDDGPCEAEC